MDFQNEFAGKGVIVTGACGVYGRMIARAFATEGARLCLTDRDQTSLDALLAELRPAEGSFTAVADLTDAGSIATLVETVGDRWGSADILINNAGIYPSGFLLDITVEDWDRILDLNLRAPFALTRGIARQMVERSVKGAIVNISSGAAHKMRRTVVPYCVSKTALDRLTKGFALELAEYGIRVNALEPGFADGSTVSTVSREHVDRLVAATPLGRATEEADIAPALLYLASSSAGYVTGATLTVDGGNSIGWLDVYQDKKTAL